MGRTPHQADDLQRLASPEAPSSPSQGLLSYSRSWQNHTMSPVVMTCAQSWVDRSSGKANPRTHWVQCKELWLEGPHAELRCMQAGVSGKQITVMFLSFSLLWPCCMAWGILVHQPGLQTMPPAVKAWSLNHWTAREVPVLLQLNLFAYVYIYYSSLFPFFFYF